MNKKRLLNFSLAIGTITSIYFIDAFSLEVLPMIIPDLLEELVGFPFTAVILAIIGIIFALIGIKSNLNKAIICLVLNSTAIIYFASLIISLWSHGFGF